LEINTPDPNPSMIVMGSSAEGATSTRLVLTMTTDWLTWRKASRSCCAFVVIDNVENVSRLSTKANGGVILMVAANRNNCSRPKIQVTQMIEGKGGEKRNPRTVTACLDNTALVVPRWWLVESRDFLFDPTVDVGGNVFDCDLPP
jgi:hypothetical protein